VRYPLISFDWGHEENKYYFVNPFLLKLATKIFFWFYLVKDYKGEKFFFWFYLVKDYNWGLACPQLMQILRLEYK
jgi:hypothetical protein